jgi:hypothetical protein
MNPCLPLFEQGHDRLELLAVGSHVDVSFVETLSIYGFTSW